MDTADLLSGAWNSVCSNIHSIAPNHEGSTICKENYTASWLLLLDNLTTNGGYELFLVDDLPNGQFKEAGRELLFPENIKYRHGSILPITWEETII